MRNVTITYDDGEKRLISKYDEELQKLFLKRSWDKHFMKKTQSFGIDLEAFNGLCDRGLEEIILYEQDMKNTYKATPEKFKEHAQYTDYGEHRKQIHLEIKHWDRD